MTAETPRPTRPREEVEVKIPCEDHELARVSLRAAGATLASARHFESNDLYDDPGKKLSGQGRTLRLRRAAGRAILTYKGPARFQGGIKVREERETEVADPAEAEAILAGLGAKSGATTAASSPSMKRRSAGSSRSRATRPPSGES